ncbi:mechanosensitive ion channel [Candidatus Peregrinibacteria bacterium]|nr:mechanosensitive ion channel [Candidatus Peregrinibacteria bacterium]
MHKSSLSICNKIFYGDSELTNTYHSMSYQTFLQYSYFGNTMKHYLIAIAIFVASLVGALILKIIIERAFRKFAKNTKTKLDDTILKIIQKVVIFIIVLGGIYFALKSLTIPENIWIYIKKGTQVIFIIKVFQGITLLSDFLIETYIAKLFRGKDGFDVQLTRLLTRIVNIALWVIGASMALNIFGYDIGAIVAGLGIGGLAIALAAQDTLGNFFSSISIIADKPYKVGDVIKFNENEGIIKDIGMRTTRIETFFGTVISVPNSELAKAIVENMSKRQSRRDDGAIGLVYDSTSEQIKKAISIIKNILKEEKNLTQDFRVFFTEYDPSSLRIEYTYYVKNPTDFNFFLKTKNKINLTIKEEFDKAGLEMAFPTQTLYVKKEE